MKPIILIAILTPLWLTPPAKAENITCTRQQIATNCCKYRISQSQNITLGQASDLISK
ncbi:hypothetical protein QUA81_01595 [Microcoleus sp. F6_B4]